jgi:nucleoside-diphosphate-sugar epimerase
MQVLVTGANGFLGRNIVLGLLEDSKVERIFAISRKPIEFNGNKVEVILGDFSDGKIMNSYLQHSDVVIHVAAKTSMYPNDFENSIQVNMIKTQNLVNLCKKAAISHFIHISTTNVYTPSEDKSFETEKSEMPQWLRQSAYAHSKNKIHRWIKQEIENGFPATILSPSFMLGKNDELSSSGKLIKYFGKSVVFYPKGGKNIVNITDVVKVVKTIISRQIIGEDIAVVGENISYKQIIEELELLQGKRKLKIALPTALLHSVYKLLKTLDSKKWLAIPLDITNFRMMTTKNYFNNRKLKSYIDFPLKNANNTLEESYNSIFKK